MSVQHVENIYRKRHSFSKIRSLVPIPNLIDIQKQSYDEFLQMNLLHEERDPRGLKTVFDAMFPVHNGKNPDGSDATLEVEFVDYTVGHWACKCGTVEGLGYLRTTCKSCGHNIVADHPKDPSVDCPKCGKKESCLMQTKCPNCGKYYLSDMMVANAKAFDEAKAAARAEGKDPSTVMPVFPAAGEQPKDVCKHCGTDRVQWYIDYYKKRRG